MELALKLPKETEMVCEPEVLKTIEKAPEPLVRVAGVGEGTLVSVELMATVPLYPVAVLPAAFLAVTVKEKGTPATGGVAPGVRTS